MVTSFSTPPTSISTESSVPCPLAWHVHVPLSEIFAGLNASWLNASENEIVVIIILIGYKEFAEMNYLIVRLNHITKIEI